MEERGHKIRYKWWEKKLKKPYLDHNQQSSHAANEMIQAASGCDVFIFFAQDNVLGATVELGAAIESTKTYPNKKIYVVYQDGTRQSVFYAHPAVKLLDDKDGIRDCEWY